MRNTIKAWAVIWTKKAMKEYGVKSSDRVVSVEPKEDVVVVFKENKKHYFADAIAVFGKKKDADGFWKKNNDWLVVPCEITYKNPELLK